MNKSPLAIAIAVIIAATAFASSAQAGFKIRLGFGGPLPAFTAHGGGYHSPRHYHRKRYLARRVIKKEKVYVAKPKPAPKVAKQEKKEKVVAKQSTAKPAVIAKVPAVEPEVIADNENSSIAAASIEPIAATDAVTEVEQPTATVGSVVAKPAKSASKLDCKKFFPSVGMTLTVPCE